MSLGILFSLSEQTPNFPLFKQQRATRVQPDKDARQSCKIEGVLQTRAVWQTLTKICPLYRLAENSSKSARFVEDYCASFPTVKGKEGGLLPCCGSQLYCHRRAQLLSLFKWETVKQQLPCGRVKAEPQLA